MHHPFPSFEADKYFYEFYFGKDSVETKIHHITIIHPTMDIFEFTRRLVSTDPLWLD